MVERESIGDSWQVRLTPTSGQRTLRIAAAAFLSVWLCGWAMGEYFAGGELLGLLAHRYAPGADLSWLPHARAATSGNATVAMIFLGLWVTAWTIGGCAAIAALVSVLFGVPVLRWNASSVEVGIEVGPFSRRQRLTWDQAEALVNPTPHAQSPRAAGGRAFTIELVDPADREAILGWLRESRESGGSTTDQARAIG